MDVLGESKALRIDVEDDLGQKIGRLSPVTRSLVDDEALIEKFTQWRNKARNHFLTQFTATTDRTKNWLQEVILKDPTRLMLIIHSREEAIGHYGFKGLSTDSVELDNLIRGEKGGHPQLIFYAERALLSWLFETFHVKKIYAYVLSHNFIALQLHQALGFRVTELIPLEKVLQRDEIHLTMGQAGGKSSEGLYVQKVELEHENFVHRKGEAA